MTLAASLEGEVGGTSCRGLGLRLLHLHLLTATGPPLLLLNLAKVCSQVQGAGPRYVPAVRYSQCSLRLSCSTQLVAKLAVLSQRSLPDKGLGLPMVCT